MGFPYARISDRLFRPSKIATQQSQRMGLVATATSNEDREQEWNDQTHHLIDGQQRSDAIALAFDDPFEFDKSTGPRNAARPALWLDLAPQKLEGTRFFLFRLTTQSHPWGYRSTDDAGRLEAKLIRSAHEKYQEAYGSPKEPLTRFTPRQSWPEQAEVPVPVQWLIKSKAQTNSFAPNNVGQKWFNSTEDTLPEDFSVNALRKLAKIDKESPTSKDSVRRNHIDKFFRPSDLDPKSRQITTSDLTIRPTLDLVDKWLSHSRENHHAEGLPSVLISSIARGSPEVYLLLAAR